MDTGASEHTLAAVQSARGIGSFHRLSQTDKETDNKSQLHRDGTSANGNKSKQEGDGFSTICNIHKNGEIRLYCQEHDMVCCVECAKEDHGTCTVKPVEEVAMDHKNTGKSLGVNNVKEMVQRLGKEINTQNNEIKHSLKTVEEMKVKVTYEVKRFRVELNKCLDEAETQILADVRRIHCENVIILTKLENECKNLENKMECLIETFDKSKDNIAQLFVKTKLAEKALEKTQQSVESIDPRNQIKSYQFEPANNMLKFEMNSTCFGNVVVQNPTDKNQSQTSTNVDNAIYARTLNVKAPNEGNCHIRGSTMVSPDELLLTDSYNKSLKILKIKENTITSRYTPLAEPWDVTSVVPGTAAATIPSKGMILFMNTVDGLSESHCLKVRNNCRGIDHHKDELVVSFFDPPTIQVLNLKGEIHHEFANTTLFDSPGYLAFGKDGESVFVSDFNRQTVYEVSKTGELKTSLKREDVKYPRGLVVSRDGNILVCSQGNGKIIVVSPSTGEARTIHVKQIQQPVTVVINEDERQLYICEFYPDCNSLKILQW